MYNKLMAEKEINVKVGDKVMVQGFKGIVTDVAHTIKTEWDGTAYVEVEGTEGTQVQVHFDEENNYGIAEYGQYQDGWYGGYVVTEVCKLIDWGKSMYGGYFANLYNGELFGLHTDTLKDLRAELAKYGFKATAETRFDNI